MNVQNPQKLLGKPVAEALLEKVKTKAADFKSRYHIPVKLAVVLVGQDPASEVYVSHKIKKCSEIGFESELVRLPKDSSQEQVIAAIQRLNADDNCHGILVQLPLPAGLDARIVLNKIDAAKDVDGLTDSSIGRLATGDGTIAPCTPSGIIEMLNFYGLGVSGRDGLVIGRSLIVGLPLFHLLNRENATVTVAHSKTKDLIKKIKDYAFVFVAVGKPHFLKSSDFSKDTVIVDVGIHRLQSGLVGDVLIDQDQHLRAYSTVPGGVGPLTIAMLMKNTLDLAIERKAQLLPAK